MNATNRIVNRALLLVTGLALAAVGMLLLLASGRFPWLDPAADAVAEWGDSVGAWAGSFLFEIPGLGEVSGGLLIGFVAAIVLLVLLIIFLATRGGGRTGTAARRETERGNTEIDARLADDLIAAVLRESTDVLSAHTGVYRVRRAPAIRISLTLRRGAQLPRVLDSVDGALTRWDALVGHEIPVVLHLQGRGWLDRWRSATRVR
ncbi:hypothetical protein D9V32_15060 [Mycetocola tolaasinivorans]|uniref:Uncharacterized protein n=1 Tax=Mycetocola tolaasinivorans TaxID=76635 RepID=A0A3L6ZY80_9MICO|nr:hypothetical protein [Mycetocola tolaasinivorans]RLP72764.1 hypothetical protein D9V32_15060 [Mycetocola tolaasinivorans]